MYAIISMNDAKYQPLADITWIQNKIPYCKKHNYAAHCMTFGFKGNIPIGFEKLFYMLDILNEHPEYEWIWWTGSDTMVTNWNIKIEDKIMPEWDLIMATDYNEINNDSFLMKNSEWSRNYLQYLIDVIPKYTNHYFYEQQAMIDSYFDHRDHFKLVPQRYLNAYKNDLYPHQGSYDCLGTDGTWQSGDWLVHWPGTTLEHRLLLAKDFVTKVIK